jgi:hypothetical protein
MKIIIFSINFTDTLWALKFEESLLTLDTVTNKLKFVDNKPFCLLILGGISKLN